MILTFLVSTLSGYNYNSLQEQKLIFYRDLIFSSQTASWKTVRFPTKIPSKGSPGSKGIIPEKAGQTPTIQIATKW